MDNEQKEQIRVALKNAELWMNQVRRAANMESALTMSEVKAARKLLEEEVKQMICIKCGGTIIAETIDAGSYDCCILRCLDCGTIVDKTWMKKSKEEVNAN